MHRFFSFVFCVMFFALTSQALSSENSGLSILRITPAGDNVQTTRQIVLEFNRPVVPLGRMERSAEEVGITITPPVACQWRWLNSSALACNLGENDALQKATSYALEIKPVIRAEDGASLAQTTRHSFTTELPAGQYAYLREWEGPALPVMRLNFTQAVTRQSVEESIHFYNPADKSSVYVTASPDEEDETPPALKDGAEARQGWLIKPRTPLAPGIQYELKEGPGLLSVEGEQKSIRDFSLRKLATFPEFSFNGLVCRDKDRKEVVISPSAPQKAESLCDPLQTAALAFSAPVLRSEVEKNIAFTPDLSGGVKGFNPWERFHGRDWSGLRSDRFNNDYDFRIALPVNLRAAQTYTVTLGDQKQTIWQKIIAFIKREKTVRLSGLKDEFGRPLAPFSFEFATGHRNPNYELAYRDAVLEKNSDSDVPVYVNNLDAFSFNYTTITSEGLAEHTSEPAAVPKVQDVQFAVPAGIRGFLGGESGAFYGHIETLPEAPHKAPQSARLFAQVTPYQLHAKLGHFSSLVWVTDLATGEAVQDATVTVYKGVLSALKPPEDIRASVQTDESGIAALPGLSEMDPDLSLFQSYKDSDPRLFIRVDKDGDMALLPVSYDYEISMWDVSSGIYSYMQPEFAHMKAWGMTAQGIYRAGDTMQYKVYVRHQDTDRFIEPPKADYTLEIYDAAGKKVEEINGISLNPFGSFSGEYTIPKSAAIGWYSFKLSAKITKDGRISTQDFYPMSVLVSDFTPAAFRVTAEINGTVFSSGDKMELQTSASLHSGGPYTDAASRTTITLKSRPFRSPHPAAKDFSFDSFDEETHTQDIYQKEAKLDQDGSWSDIFTLPEKEIVYGKLNVESAVRDDRGKSIAGYAEADYIGVDRLVGLKTAQWVFGAGEPASIQAIVVTPDGTPAAGTPVKIVIEKQKIAAAKVKGAGNAYINDNTVEWRPEAECSITSAATAQECVFTPETAGTYKATAIITDTKGRAHQTTYRLWVSGKDYVQWHDGRNSHALSIVPESGSYKVGDTARYLVQNPYPGARALITIERYGILDSFIQTFDSSTPVIEIPVKPDYVPGFYLSATVASPRVDAPPPELGQIDMGKPAFRTGYIQTDIIDPYKQVKVEAVTDKDIYRPRETVQLSLSASPLNPDGRQEPLELAVAVLDESVFDLMAEGRKAFDPYAGFYSLDAVDVANYSLMTRLLGRQKFEKKGANPGGDGGVDIGMRNIFKFVSYWNPSVPVGADGTAKISFEAPDNLTGWKILALAVSPTDRMGLGEAGFKVNRETEIRPVMPNNVREGDSFSAGFSVMNRTDAPRTITISINAQGDLAGNKETAQDYTLTLEPYKRETVHVPLQAAMLPVNRDAGNGTILFSVSAGDSSDRDGLEHSLPVLKSRITEMAAFYGSTTEELVSLPFSVPSGVHSDTGEISVTLSPSVIASLDGAFRYMRDYTYMCWEQRLSMAVAANHYKALKPYLSDDTVWDGAEELAQDILSASPSYQAPNGGMTYYNGKDAYVDPYLSAYTALAFQWLKQAEHRIPANVEENLEKYLMGFMRNNIAPAHYGDDMIATVRAVILAAYADKITKDDVLRLRPQIQAMGLFGKAHYMLAAQKFDETKEAAQQALDAILAQGVESSGKLSFNQSYSAGYERILATPMRDNCAVLSALLAQNERNMLNDTAPKIVRAITQTRSKRDHYENTQENLFCMNALIDYARQYEGQNPAMTLKAQLGEEIFGAASFNSLKDSPVTLEKPLDESMEGRGGTISMKKEGEGRYYYTARLQYAPKDAGAHTVNAGMDIRRVYSALSDGGWKAIYSPATLKRGDLVRVDLYLSIPTARNFVVVDDPLPGALETINRDLATSSQHDAASAEDEDEWTGFGSSRWSFYHKELRHDSARFYADWLPAGKYRLSYMAQAIAAGSFDAPPVKAEEMYDPDIYGMGLKEQVVVDENP